MKVFSLLYPWRFHIYLFTQLLVIFGTLMIPVKELELLLLSLFLLLNLIGGLAIISHRKILLRILVTLIIFQFVLAFWRTDSDMIMRGRTALFMVLYIIMFTEIILQLVRAERVNPRVILGMFSGYITLGFIGLFLLQLVLMDNPEALYFVLGEQNGMHADSSEIMYFSFITLLTIGYGDILPNSLPAQKTAVLLGLAGQFYLTVVIAMIVGKYLKERD